MINYQNKIKQRYRLENNIIIIVGSLSLQFQLVTDSMFDFVRETVFERPEGRLENLDAEINKIKKIVGFLFSPC